MSATTVAHFLARSELDKFELVVTGGVTVNLGRSFELASFEHL